METRSQELKKKMEDADKRGIEISKDFFTTILNKDKNGKPIEYNFETIEGTGYRFDFLVTATTEDKEYYFVVEVKIRNVDECKKEWDDIMMEEVKWDAQFQYDAKYRPLYFNVENPKDNNKIPLSVSIFDLISIRGHLGEMRYNKTWAPKRSVKENEDEELEYEWKKTYFLPKFNKRYNKYYRWDADEQTFVMTR